MKGKQTSAGGNSTVTRVGGGALRHAGFTLLELMTVLVILGILVSVALPSYSAYAERARRSDGQGLLTDVAARQERYFYSNNTYTTDLTALGFSASPANSPEGYYQVAAAACGTGTIANCYALTATPQGQQASDACANLTLDSFGTKGKSGSGNRCWGD